MIITATANPALDVIYELNDELRADGLNRASATSLRAGGKGINATRAILRDGCSEVCATALLGGATGELFVGRLAEEGIVVEGISAAFATRVNVCAVSPAGEACEINAPGGPATTAELAAFGDFILNRASLGDVAILSGSLPPVADVDATSFYAELISALKKKGCATILDCSGEALRLAVNGENPPDAIKPNLEELCELCGARADEATDTEELFRFAEKASAGIAERGISVLATLGARGSVWTPAGGGAPIRQRSYPVARATNVKGAGDTFLGVFAHRYWLRKEAVGDALDAASRAAAAHVGG